MFSTGKETRVLEMKRLLKVAKVGKQLIEDDPRITARDIVNKLNLNHLNCLSF